MVVLASALSPVQSFLAGSVQEEADVEDKDEEEGPGEPSSCPAH